MKNIKLTIAIPSLPERMDMYLRPLFDKLTKQIGDEKDIEILSIMDNRIMSVGRKRTALFHIAQGKYTCIIDDDDDVTDDFVETLRNTITDDLNVDVICYDQEANMNGRIWTVKTSLNYNKIHPFDQMQYDQYGNTIPCCRPPWHWCAWNTEFARQFSFGDSNTQEDTLFVLDALERAKTQVVLDKTLCKYRWSPSVSQAEYRHIDPRSVNKVSL